MKTIEIVRDHVELKMGKDGIVKVKGDVVEVTNEAAAKLIANGIAKESIKSTTKEGK
jgi:hypothetical protein